MILRPELAWFQPVRPISACGPSTFGQLPNWGSTEPPSVAKWGAGVLAGPIIGGCGDAASERWPA
jgi:hypothetical protein